MKKCSLVREHQGFGLLIRQLLYPFQALSRPPEKTT
jgi:hypothetical protein